MSRVHARALLVLESKVSCVRVVAMVFYCPLTRKCWKRRTTGSFNSARCLGLTLITVTTKTMEFNLLSLELTREKTKRKLIKIMCDLPSFSIRLKQTDRACWTTQTHSDERNSARRQTFHELNSLSLVRLMKRSMSLRPWQHSRIL